MKTMIYYFSGTGNSLAVAKALVKELDGVVEICPLAKNDRSKPIRVDADRLGFVFPVYNLTAPRIVQSFLKEIELIKNTYIFSVVTCNGVPGHSLYTVDRLLRHRQRKLSMGFAVDMPGNILMNPVEVQNERLAKSKAKIRAIAQKIREEKDGLIEGDNSFAVYVKGWILDRMIDILAPSTKRFIAEKNCSECGICTKVCSMGNISMGAQNRPIWGGKCTFCMACYHWCPQNAVAMKGQKSKLQPYHHPEIGSDEIIGVNFK